MARNGPAGACRAGDRPRWLVTSRTSGREGGAMFGKVRVMVTDCPRFIVIFDNGKRTRLYPVIAGRR